MKFNNQYRGIVIQNNDPKQSGRVKVFVPGINLTQTKNWNQKKEEDKFFKTLGNNTNTSLTPEILADLKNKLFWATVVTPVAGSGTAGIYNASNDVNVIGNDSGYIFQDSNKKQEFFKKDERDFEQRQNKPIQNPSYGIQPFTQMNLSFSFSGKRYCLKNSCDNSSQLNSFWPTNNGPLDEIIKQLPKNYSDQTIDLDFSDDDKNNGVIGVILDVFNPTIFFNEQELPKDSPLYNPECYVSPVDSDSVNFSPPIFYEEVDEQPQHDYDSVPVQISINGKLSNSDFFKIDSFDDEQVVYKKDQLKIKVPLKNVNSITIRHNKNRFDINRILSLLPLLRTALNLVGQLIMPRAPYPKGNKPAVRGGGGAALYSNVTTNLLPTNQRLQSRIKGQNNDSKTQTNKGRRSDNDPNKTLGNNLTGKISQAHRGPMTSIDYSNEFKGMISIPGVGSHVWVQFENGDTNYPFVVGIITNSSDVGGIFQVNNH